ncbi:hypothetical protein FE257_011764 [Aspergillus nanangensis]|uniref:Zn(2)-C6 fungal-type domain-containing protein n=1 Tax=Aspergillus nanangensis TaxID=2582783 RepID=A0AAD4CVQ6_ASPNN|nr:hypothetical protein FE257_011764 [Aspergillus nanangensis]
MQPPIMRSEPCLMNSPPETEPRGESIQSAEDEVDSSAKTAARPKRGKYISKACTECKRRKSKCNGRHPCSRCVHHDITCWFPGVYLGKHTLNRSLGVYPTHNGRQTRRTANLEEVRQLKQQIASLQREAKTRRELEHNDDFTSPLPDPVHSRRLSHPSPHLQQTSPTSLHELTAVPDAADLTEPHHRQAASNYAFNFRLARTHLDAMGIVNENRDSDGDPGSQLPSGLQTPSSSADPLWAIPRREAIRLTSVYEEEIGISYPLLNIQKITSHISHLYDALEAATRCGFSYLALPGPSVIPREDLYIVKMAIYEFLADHDLFAWRLIGIVARWCLELRLNQASVLDRMFTNPEDLKYSIRLFWSIHTLDRRWGFGTGLPFAIQNDDIDSALPEPDDEVPYLKAMVAYSRIGSKVWYSTYSARLGSPHLRRDDVGYLDYLVTQWFDSLPEFLRVPPEGSPPAAEPSRGLQRLKLLLHLRAGYLKILLYQPVLHSVSQMRTNWSHTKTVVDIAKDTIRRLDRLNRTTDIYQTQQMCFNHFLVTSLGIIFLAVSIAPAEFSDIVREEFYMALDLVKSFSGNSFVSRRLWNMIRGLREIGGKLGLGGSASGRGQLDLDGQEGNGPVVESSTTAGVIHSNPMPYIPSVALEPEPSSFPGPCGGLTNNAQMLTAGGFSETISGLQMTQDLSEMFETMEQGRSRLDGWGSISETPRGPPSIGEIDFSQIVADLF